MEFTLAFGPKPEFSFSFKFNFKFQYPEKFIMKKTANKCSKNSSIFEMGMLLYIKRKRIYVRKICLDIIDQRIRAILSV